MVAELLCYLAYFSSRNGQDARTPGELVEDFAAQLQQANDAMGRSLPPSVQALADHLLESTLGRTSASPRGRRFFGWWMVATHARAVKNNLERHRRSPAGPGAARGAGAELGGDPRVGRAPMAAPALVLAGVRRVLPRHACDRRLEPRRALAALRRPARGGQRAPGPTGGPHADPRGPGGTADPGEDRGLAARPRPAPDQRGHGAGAAAGGGAPQRRHRLRGQSRSAGGPAVPAARAGGAGLSAPRLGRRGHARVVPPHRAAAALGPRPDGGAFWPRVVAGQHAGRQRLAGPVLRRRPEGGAAPHRRGAGAGAVHRRPGQPAGGAHEARAQQPARPGHERPAGAVRADPRRGGGGADPRAERSALDPGACAGLGARADARQARAHDARLDPIAGRDLERPARGDARRRTALSLAPGSDRRDQPPGHGGHRCLGPRHARRSPGGLEAGQQPGRCRVRGPHRVPGAHEPGIRVRPSPQAGGRARRPRGPGSGGGPRAGGPLASSASMPCWRWPRCWRRSALPTATATRSSPPPWRGGWSACRRSAGSVSPSSPGPRKGFTPAFVVAAYRKDFRDDPWKYAALMDLPSVDRLLGELGRREKQGLGLPTEVLADVRSLMRAQTGQTPSSDRVVAFQTVRDGVFLLREFLPPAAALPRQRDRPRAAAKRRSRPRPQLSAAAPGEGRGPVAARGLRRPSGGAGHEARPGGRGRPRASRASSAAPWTGSSRAFSRG